MDEEVRRKAAQAVLKAVRTAESSAAEHAASFFAESVTLVTDGEVLAGPSAVRQHLAAQWPLTPVYQRGAWSMPTQVTDGTDAMQMVATFPGIGAAPLSTKIVVDFTDKDEIARIEIVTERSAAPQPATELSPELRALINNALANGTPMVVGYVDEEGKPSLSLRGSVQCISGTQLCIWARPTSKGLTASLPHRPAMSLLYRDSRTRTTLIISGTGRIVTDEKTREEIFLLAPEVEQNHDPSRSGTAIIIDIEKVTGSSPDGPVLVQPSR